MEDKKEQELQQSLAKLHTKIDVLRYVSTLEPFRITKETVVKELACQSLCSESKMVSLLEISPLEDIRNILRILNEIAKLSNSYGCQTSVEVAPIGLLSLKDYSVIQAAIEVTWCWCAYPMASTGIFVLIEKRYATKTLKLSKRVLALSLSEKQCEKTSMADAYLTVIQVLYNILIADQFKAMMLPSYLADLFAALIDVQLQLPQDTDAKTMLDTLLGFLPLQLCIDNLRRVLGRTRQENFDACYRAKFKASCSDLLVQAVMAEGGVHAAIASFLENADKANSQLQMNVATLLSSTPQSVSTAAVYLERIGPQILVLLGPEHKNTVFQIIATLVLCRFTTSHPLAADRWIFSSALRPLLVYEHADVVELQDSHPIYVHEKELELCLERLFAMVQCPTLERSVELSLLPSIRPLLHLFARVHKGKSRVKGAVEALVLKLLTRMHPKTAAVLIFCSVLKNRPPLRRSLQNATATVRRKQVEFGPGETGGIVLRAVADSDADASDRDGASSVVLFTVLVTENAEKLSHSAVLGELFLVLLIAYVNLRTSHKLEFELEGAEPQHAFSAQLEEYKVHMHNLSEYDAVVILHGLVEVSSLLGPSVLHNATQMLQTLHLLLKSFGEDEKEAEEDIACVALGLVTTIVEAGPASRDASEEKHIRNFLPELERLSVSTNAQIAEMSALLRSSILTRGHKSPAERRPASQLKCDTFDAVMASAREELASSVVPLRAKGIVRLTKLVRSPGGQIKLTDNNLKRLVDIFMENLVHSESYVYLAAVQGLSMLGEQYPNTMVPLLVGSLTDQERSVEQRIKLGEALMFTARKAGEGVHRFASVYVYAFLAAARRNDHDHDHNVGALTNSRPVEQSSSSCALIQEIEPDAPPVSKETHTHARDPHVGKPCPKESLASATLRASSLSNLAEVCALLKWAIHPFAVDVVTCVLGVLQFETEFNASSNAVRRAAVYLIDVFLRGFGADIVQVVPEYVKGLFDTLRTTRDRDRDDIVKYHAIHAIGRINDIMSGRVFTDFGRGGGESRFLK